MNDQELIFFYLDGSLSDAERRDFEARLGREPGLAAELAKARESASALQRTFRYEADKSAAMDMMKRVDEEGQGYVRPFWATRAWMAVAAVLLLLAVATWIFIRIGTGPTVEQLLTESRYFDPQAAASTTMGEQGAPGPYEQGYALYKEGAYAEAAKLLLQVPESDLRYSRAQLMIGTAYLALDRADEAQPFLLRARSDEDLAEYARWHLALAYLASGDQQQAKTEFEEVARLNRYKRQEAEEVLAHWPVK